MEGLRNPFAVRNGNVILIEDLTLSERGLKCQCRCPDCDGDFIARMGDVKVHHFAHSKNACDEVLAYTSGLYRLIHQILSSGSPFYVPALAVSYVLPCNEVINETNAASYIRIVSDSGSSKNKVMVSPGRHISFDSAEIVFDSKNQMQAIELSYQNSRMAIKVMPPDTVCKIADVSPHKDMATLVLDFAVDADIIQSSNSDTFKAYLLSEKLSKRWIQNAKIEKAYSEIIALSEKAFQERKDIEKQREAERRSFEKQHELKRVKNNDSFDNVDISDFEFGKYRSVPQPKPLYDRFGKTAWQCIHCGKIKSMSEGMVYGGIGIKNKCQCYECLKKIEKIEKLKRSDTL